MRLTFLLCSVLLIRDASSLLQSAPRLVRCDSQQQHFDVRGKISTLGAGYQNPVLVLKREGEGYDRYLPFSDGIRHHERRGGHVRQEGVEGSTNLLRLNSRIPVPSHPDHLEWRAAVRVTQPEICKVQPQNTKERVEQRTGNPGWLMATPDGG